MGYLDESQLASMGFRSYGKNVKISSHSNIYGASMISIGNNVRIDDFCIVSAGPGGIELGNYIHIACYCSLIGKEKIVMEDFSGLSSRTCVYSSSDDYSGNAMTNPMVPEKYTNVKHAPVFIRKHVIVGSGSVILPGVEIGAGSAIGALSLVTKSISPGMIAIGNPAKELIRRKCKIFEIENQMREDGFGW